MAFQTPTEYMLVGHADEDIFLCAHGILVACQLERPADINLTFTHMDLLSVLPDFHTKPYAHILPPLERSKITTVDLITLDTLEIAKRAHVPPADVRRLCASIIKALHHDIGFDDVDKPASAEPSSSINDDLPTVLGSTTKLDLSQWSMISTLDTALDDLLGGGVPTSYVTEVTGESGSGKTQFLLTLLLAVQLPSPRGLGKNAIYISTEAPLSTPRLSQLIDSHPYLSNLPRDRAPTLENILSINAMDLESQDHILNYQLPVAIQRYNVGLIVIDSITSNYRAEHTAHNILGLSTRSGELTKLGQMLRNLAIQENLAIVVANQVSDRFDAMDGPSAFPRIGGGVLSSQPQLPSAREPGTASPLPRVRATESGNIELSQPNAMLPSSPSPFPSSPYTAEEDPQQPFDGSYLVGNPVRHEILSLLHQQRFFTGWGDSPQSFLPSSYPGFQRPSQKTPALGLVWSTQIACRIALKKERPTAIAPLLPECTPIPPTAKLHPEPEIPGSPNEREKPKPDALTESVTQGKDAEAEAGSDTVPLPVPLSENKPTSSQLPTSSSQTPERSVRRTMKLVFAPWTAGSVDEHNHTTQDEVSFTICKGGLQSCE
ncbi:P-loop containing nucleoside triphosphate hydrolase protein [Aspergillus bertholletiae]|uniref:P-loop containing nucleoside triphosphate hydrolase protein n=1 Tax=Aspergillus bertholletiae TaxID=1226010 RepID=A0A5N7AUZ5_9EURO|nr:P-loop containing nucleoside triphosphate hydrolase protein [Aspergillus bertholletiae]